MLLMVILYYYLQIYLKQIISSLNLNKSKISKSKATDTFVEGKIYFLYALNLYRNIKNKGLFRDLYLVSLNN